MIGGNILIFSVYTSMTSSIFVTSVSPNKATNGNLSSAYKKKFNKAENLLINQYNLMVNIFIIQIN